MKKCIFSYLGFLISFTAISGLIAMSKYQASASDTGVVFYLTQAGGVNLEDTLLKLPKPNEIQGKVTSIFSANAYRQKALNFQVKLTPEEAVKFYQEKLLSIDYQERTVNTTVGEWGFNLVFNIPPSLSLPPKDASKKVVLVIQGTQLSPTMLNINIRFEEI
jgi:hypothetical protein